MEPPRPRGVPWGPQLVSELQEITGEIMHQTFFRGTVKTNFAQCIPWAAHPGTHGKPGQCRQDAGATVAKSRRSGGRDLRYT
jgi:hypothetical protein